MSDIAVIITSHGYFAKEALASVEMITGYKQENCAVVSISEGKDYADCLAEIKVAYASLDTSAGTLILCDIYGGTPANISTYLAIENSNIIIYSGFNLPILLEILLTKSNMNLTEISEKIEKIHKFSLTNITEKLKGSIQDGNQMDSY